MNKLDDFLYEVCLFVFVVFSAKTMPIAENDAIKLLWAVVAVGILTTYYL